MTRPAASDLGGAGDDTTGWSAGQAAWLGRVPACSRHDPALFFPEDLKGRKHTEAIEEAKLICSLCPCRTTCLSDALARCEPQGIWGGTTPIERVVLRARARRR